MSTCSLYWLSMSSGIIACNDIEMLNENITELGCSQMMRHVNGLCHLVQGDHAESQSFVQYALCTQTKLDIKLRLTPHTWCR